MAAVSPNSETVVAAATAVHVVITGSVNWVEVTNVQGTNSCWCVFRDTTPTADAADHFFLSGTAGDKLMIPMSPAGDPGTLSIISADATTCKVLVAWG